MSTQIGPGGGPGGSDGGPPSGRHWEMPATLCKTTRARHERTGMTIDGSVKSLDTREGDGAAGAATFKANFVYETLKRRILDGVYAPGDWLRLSQLAREFSLSEMPIREALRILQADGLVVLHLHRGA